MEQQRAYNVSIKCLWKGGVTNSTNVWTTSYKAVMADNVYQAIQMVIEQASKGDELIELLDVHVEKVEVWK